MRNCYWLLLLLAGCATVQPTPTKAPAPAPVIPPGSTLVIVAGLPTMANNVDTAMLTSVVNGSQCSKYAFGNRGPAPLGYLKGIVTSYARTLCYFNSPLTTYAATIGQPLGTDAQDALNHYNILHPWNGGERIKQTYTLLIGLGLRESSGQYGLGWDRSKLKDTPPIQPTAINSESGAFQVSFDNNSKMPASAGLYAQYQAHPERCALDVFKEGSDAIVQDFVGSGPGYDFQHFMRYCPALQVDYAAAGIRVNRGQWGPLNRKEAEYYQPCEDMLSKVEVALKCN